MATSRPSNSHSSLQRELNNLDGNHPIAQFLAQYGTTILGALGVLFLALLLLYYFATGRDNASESDFINADRQFELLERHLTAGAKGDENAAIAALDKLETLIKRYPQLNTKYDGPLAQLLLSSGMQARALPYAERLLTRTHPDLSLLNYNAFGKTTLDIANGQDATALKDAQTLQEQLTHPASELAAFNALRVASLQPNATATAQAWQSLREKLQSNAKENESYQHLAALLHDGDVSVLQYIDQL